MRVPAFITSVGPVLVASVVALSAVACASGSTGGQAANGAGSSEVAGVGGNDMGSCPAAAISVVVSVDPWADIVKQLGGACTDVTTIVTSSAGDPHDYEPTAADNARLGGARLAVVNGLGYDAWADKALDASSTRPAVVDAGDVVGLRDGDNPHIWYGPTYVELLSAAVTKELSTLIPAAAPYFEQRAAAWKTQLQPYIDEVASVKQAASGKSYAATEPVFAYMADAIGLHDLTPEGYRNSTANGSEPSPGDIHDFQTALRDQQVDVLVFNTQTEGAIPQQFRETAADASVPAVDITETVPAGGSSFVQWQVGQLRAMLEALA